MKTLLSLTCIMLVFLSCGKDQLCNEAESSVPGVISSIKGPDTLSIGKTVAIVLEVATNDSFCIKRAEGSVIAVSNNYVQVSATLVQAATDQQHCNCIHTPTVKTLVYFTPNKKGRYAFGTKEPDSNMVNAVPDSSDYKVFVP